MAGGRRNKRKKVPSPATLSLSTSPEEQDNLVDDLLAQLDARDSDVRDGVEEMSNEVENRQREALQIAPKKDSKSRFRAREMRKAAAHAAQQISDDVEATEKIKKETQDEERAIRGICDTRGLEMHQINPDGHCLFAAVADQLSLLSIIPAENANYQTTRRAAADYIASHRDDFIPFLSLSDGENGSKPTEAGLMNLQEFDKYCACIRDTGTWGGEPEILALASAFNVPIHVIQWGVPPVVVHCPHAGLEETSTDRIVQISYHRRMYGLGEAALQFVASKKHSPPFKPD